MCDRSMTTRLNAIRIEGIGDASLTRNRIDFTIIAFSWSTITKTFETIWY